ncbi:hypothetical protein [Brevibacillus laterosporus]|uniref:hypothetical protein n=1 Tax=Brevibacillus laterosporus TaxID=1465 RepID=UPI00265674C5|nr:hypothetical protein [Brevibacillus laterosporus]MDN9008947.1 hypothetical protein [Brevibacillus laterosporus]MDO0941054.1 hypothetical protein [Brevibacillus laterosporus]
MEYNNFLKCLALIWVIPKVNQDVEVVNPTPVQSIDTEKKGDVLELMNSIFAKMSGEQKDCEGKDCVLPVGQHTDLLPASSESDNNYNVLKQITEIDLREYLQSKIIPKELLLKLIQILSILKKISSEQSDPVKENLYLLSSGQLKVKDGGKSARRDRTYLYPRNLLIGLATKQATLFLAFVEKMASELYNEWKQYYEMNSLTCYMYGVISEKKLPLPENIANEATQPLLPVHEPALFEQMLESKASAIRKEETEKMPMEKQIVTKQDNAVPIEQTCLEQKEQAPALKKHPSQINYTFTIQSNHTLKKIYFVPTGKHQKNVVVLFSKR